MKKKASLDWKWLAAAALALVLLGGAGWYLYARFSAQPGYDYIKVERGPLHVGRGGAGLSVGHDPETVLTRRAPALPVPLRPGNPGGCAQEPSANLKDPQSMATTPRLVVVR